MKLLVTLALALAPLRAHAARLGGYARNSTSHPGRCDRNVFEREFYLLAKGLEPTSDKVTAHSYETMYGLCGNQPVCRRRVDGVEDDAMMQHERAVKFSFPHRM